MIKQGFKRRIWSLELRPLICAMELSMDECAKPF